MKIIIVISIVSFIFFLSFIILWACIKYSYKKEIEDIFEWFETKNIFKRCYYWKREL